MRTMEELARAQTGDRSCSALDPSKTRSGGRMFFYPFYPFYPLYPVHPFVLLPMMALLGYL